MALPTIVENLDNVPEGNRSLYTESEDGFVLDIEGIDAHPDVVHLKTAYSAEKNKRTKQGKELKTARDALTAAEALVEDFPSDFNIDVWTAAKEGKGNDAALTALRDKMVELRTKLEGDINVLKEENTGLKKSGERAVVERRLDDLIAESGVTVPAYKRAVRAELLGKITIDDGGKPVIESDELGPLPVADYLKRYLAADGKDFVKAPSGGGGPGNESGGGGKTISRADFEALNAIKRMKAIKDGVTVTE